MADERTRLVSYCQSYRSLERAFTGAYEKYRMAEEGRKNESVTQKLISFFSGSAPDPITSLRESFAKFLRAIRSVCPADDPLSLLFLPFAWLQLHRFFAAPNSSHFCASVTSLSSLDR